MAHMIPANPKEFDERSHEGDVFNALKKLPDDYYVFHSVSTVGVTDDNVFYERELDFVVASPKKGILAIEVKAGNNIHFVGRTWRYSSGRVMSHGGPYNQAATAKRALSNKFTSHSDERIRELYKKTKFMHAVFFPEMTQEKMEAMQGLPEDADIRITLCADDLVNPTKKIAEMFSVTIPAVRTNTDETRISDEDFQLILDEVLCPHFNLIPSPQAKTIAINERMNQLLREQYLVLDFLEEQESAVINGAAGTGKTMVAVEKARRHSVNGDKVLFLCYNRMLCEKLIEDHKNNESKAYRKQFENVDFMTISRLAKKATGDFRNYDCLYEWLLECIDKKHELGYKHIIVDEGQDFGKRLETDPTIKSDILELFSDYGSGVYGHENTSFFVFYDKNQLVNSRALPVYLQNVDSKLTLYRNCRNTKNVANTAYSLLPTAPVMFERAWDGEMTSFIFYSGKDELLQRLDSTISNLAKESNSDRVIISCSDSLKYSDIQEKMVNDPDGRNFSYKSNGKKTRLYSCSTFKGLEADDVLITDISDASFVEGNCDFYVAASRTKKRLFVFVDIEQVHLTKIIEERFPDAFPIPDNAKRLALAMHGIAK